jgi:putative ABC transport system substrate-binding protein
MNTRRKLIFALTAAALLPRGAAAQPAKVFRVGWISMAKPGAPSLFFDAFRQGLREFGYIDGRNLILDARWADGSRERADQMVVELAQWKADVIVTQGGATLSAIRHAGTIPVVMGYSGDPVEAKFVASFARPGGTRTGMTWLALELVGKRLELLKEISPGLKRVAVIANPEHPGDSSEFEAAQVAARALGISLSYFPTRDVEELERAFAAIEKQPIEGIVVHPDAFTLGQREKIAAFGLKRRVPTISGWSTFAESGNLMTYGPNLFDSYKRLAVFVDKILKGTKPADLPVELPTTVELAINMKTAKALGIKIPNSILVRADKVIE